MRHGHTRSPAILPYSPATVTHFQPYFTLPEKSKTFSKTPGAAPALSGTRIGPGPAPEPSCTPPVNPVRSSAHRFDGELCRSGGCLGADAGGGESAGALLQGREGRGGEREKPRSKLLIRVETIATHRWRPLLLVARSY